jgi:hypothetical protein
MQKTLKKICLKKKKKKKKIDVGLKKKGEKKKTKKRKKQDMAYARLPHGNRIAGLKVYI